MAVEKAVPPPNLEADLIKALAERRWSLLGVDLPTEIRLHGPLQVFVVGLAVLEEPEIFATRQACAWRYFLEAPMRRFAVDMVPADARGERFTFASAQNDLISAHTLAIARRRLMKLSALLRPSMLEFPSMQSTFLLLQDDARDTSYFFSWTRGGFGERSVQQWDSLEKWIAYMRENAGALLKRPRGNLPDGFQTL